jgi:hypothetical protein
MWPLVIIVWIVRDYMVLWIHFYDDTNHVFNMLAQFEVHSPEYWI